MKVYNNLGKFPFVKREIEIIIFNQTYLIKVSILSSPPLFLNQIYIKLKYISSYLLPFHPLH